MLTDILDLQLFTLSGTPITIGTLVMALIILLVTGGVSRIVQRGLARTLVRRGITQEGSVAAGKRLVHYTVMLVGTAVALETVGIDLAALFAAGAIFAIGLGFAMQNIAQNFMSGVILLIERSIKPGDVLEVQNTVVRVQQMGIRSTVARTRDDEELIIPNSVLVQTTVKNFTLQDSLYRIRAAVGVVYGSDLRLVFDTLTRTAAGLEWRTQERDPRILLLAFGSSSVDFEVSVWIDDPWDSRRALSDLNTAIWWALKEAHVVIAFPQLDVHFDPPITEALQTRGARDAA
ncbi:MAG: mechanosensitive ion channel [Gemmatimonadota bacterium]|nr:mechanosensitive ion channel [Gemmatimonadota bacterium]